MNKYEQLHRKWSTAWYFHVKYYMSQMFYVQIFCVWKQSMKYLSQHNSLLFDPPWTVASRRACELDQFLWTRSDGRRLEIWKLKFSVEVALKVEYLCDRFNSHRSSTPRDESDASADCSDCYRFLQTQFTPPDRNCRRFRLAVKSSILCYSWN